MAGITRTQVSDARGAGRLLVDASAGIVDIVERMHRTIQRVPGVLGRPVDEATRGITGIVYRSVRGGMHLVGRGLDATLAPLEGLLPAGASTPGRDVYVAILNGVHGDHLERTGNPLAIDMHLVRDGVPLELGAGSASPGRADRGTGKLLVLVHGLCMSVQQWTRDGHDHGRALGEACGHAPLYLRYNSGLHVAENGRRFAETLERLVDRWPCRVDEIAIIGHSMGGLVARSACLVAEQNGMRWRESLRRLVFLGTPHLGAPLERGGHGLDFLLELSPYSAPFTRLGRTRSAGIRDLRHGTITGGAHRHVPLPKGVACHAIAASLGDRRGLVADRLVGDGLVPLDSALGRHGDPARSLRFPAAHRWVGHRMGHLELLHRPEVFAQLRAWFDAPPK